MESDRTCYDVSWYNFDFESWPSMGVIEQKINNSKSPQFVVVLQLTDNRLKILDLVLRRLHRGFCLILAHFSVYFYRKFLCFWFFKLTKSHQKVTSKDRTIICCNKYWQNDFSDRSKRNFFYLPRTEKKQISWRL